VKNRLSDLNDHLFAQLERLSDEDLTPEQIDQESKRGEAIVAIADQIVRNASLQLQAAKIAFDGGADPVPYLPAPALAATPATANATKGKPLS
jgi:hypothetical protein